MIIKFLDGTSREIANLRGADLRGADLRGADLRGADLTDANLYGADLTDANLTDANLRRANLRRANLYGANLTDANLYGANLTDANLRRANLYGANLANCTLPVGYRIARLDFGGWSVTVTPKTTSIGCQTHPNAKWLKADRRWIAAMADNATEWWKMHGATVRAAIRSMSK